jgi:hypothetical protein
LLTAIWRRPGSVLTARSARSSVVNEQSLNRAHQPDPAAEVSGRATGADRPAAQVVADDLEFKTDRHRPSLIHTL